jgi:hypothetical protein
MRQVRRVIRLRRGHHRAVALRRTLLRLALCLRADDRMAARLPLRDGVLIAAARLGSQRHEQIAIDRDFGHLRGELFELGFRMQLGGSFAHGGDPFESTNDKSDPICRVFWGI